MRAEGSHGLRSAEERLRAAGLTGAQAFDALEAALRARLGDDEVGEVHPEAEAAVRGIPVGQEDALLGLAYERFFADLFKGRRGQYFTPPPLGKLLVDLAGVQRGQTVLDPACGSGGLLIAAAARGAQVRGVELDPRLARLARLTVRLAGHTAEVIGGDMFQQVLEPVDHVIANPPFSVPIRDEAALARFGLPVGTLSDALFVRALPGWVRPGGSAAVVMPWSLLTNPRWSDARDVLDEHFRRERVLGLPEGVFRPFGGAAGRAVLLWLRRRSVDAPGLLVPTRFATLADPGYDPRSVALKLTSDTELQARRAGHGWSSLPDGAWAPSGEVRAGRPVGELATVRRERAAAAGPVSRLDLADVDRTVGEAHPVPVDQVGSRWRLAPGDVLVSRLRPELGNVVVAPCEAVGSPEWVVLAAPRYGHYLWLALRTAGWRAQLPLTGGQTRPRTTAQAVLDSRVPWPDEALVAAVDAEVAELHAQRQATASRLEALQAAMAALVDDGDDGPLRGLVEEGRGR